MNFLNEISFLMQGYEMNIVSLIQRWQPRSSLAEILKEEMK